MKSIHFCVAVLIIRVTCCAMIITPMACKSRLAMHEGNHAVHAEGSLAMLYAVKLLASQQLHRCSTKTIGW